MSPDESATKDKPAAPAGEPDKRMDLEAALAEIERLSRDAKEHAASRSTAERQAADLTTLRKFHEKARAEIERLKNANAVLTAEKEAMAKDVAEATVDRRKREAAEGEAEKLKWDVKRLEGEKAALEKKLAESSGWRAEREKLTAEVERLKKELEAFHSSATVAHGDALAEEVDEELSKAAVPAIGMLETRAMAVLPGPEALLEIPPPTAVTPPPKAATPPPRAATPLPVPPPVPAAAIRAEEAAKSGGDKIKYLCEGCGHKLGAPREFIGTFGTCKHCGHRGKVPAESTR